jgi:hypothetical protein
MDKRAVTMQTWETAMIEKEKSKIIEARKSVRESERNDDDELAFNIVLEKTVRNKRIDSGPSKIKK